MIAIASGACPAQDPYTAVIAGAARPGRIVEFVPHPVIAGFTTGIGVR